MMCLCVIGLSSGAQRSIVIGSSVELELDEDLKKGVHGAHRDFRDKDFRSQRWFPRAACAVFRVWERRYYVVGKRRVWRGVCTVFC